MEAVVGPEMPNNHKSTIPSIHRNRPSQTHFPLPSFIVIGHHERIFPVPSFIATGHHERISPAVIHRNRPSRTHSPLPSFPRRRESGCAIHEPFYEHIQ